MIYDTTTECYFFCQTWILEVTSGKKIKLTFESFNLEPSSTCRLDYVQVSSGSVDETYCGSSMPSPIISSGNTMTVFFHSDGSVNRNGFKATWKAVGPFGMFFGQFLVLILMTAMSYIYMFVFHDKTT